MTYSTCRLNVAKSDLKRLVSQQLIQHTQADFCQVCFEETVSREWYTAHHSLLVQSLLWRDCYTWHTWHAGWMLPSLIERDRLTRMTYSTCRLNVAKSDLKRLSRKNDVQHKQVECRQVCFKETVSQEWNTTHTGWISSSFLKRDCLTRLRCTPRLNITKSD